MLSQRLTAHTRTHTHTQSGTAVHFNAKLPASTAQHSTAQHDTAGVEARGARLPPGLSADTRPGHGDAVGQDTDTHLHTCTTRASHWQHSAGHGHGAGSVRAHRPAHGWSPHMLRRTRERAGRTLPCSDTRAEQPRRGPAQTTETHNA